MWVGAVLCWMDGWQDLDSCFCLLPPAAASTMIRRCATAVTTHCPHLPPPATIPLQEEMKDKSDLFDEMVEHEEKIRLGEAGWKERYYQVRAVSVGGRPALACVCGREDRH